MKINQEKYDRIISWYKRLTLVKEVPPSYRVLAKAAKVAVGTAYKAIQFYQKEGKK